jgi:hypothetical protein
MIIDRLKELEKGLTRARTGGSVRGVFTRTSPPDDGSESLVTFDFAGKQLLYSTTAKNFRRVIAEYFAGKWNVSWAPLTDVPSADVLRLDVLRLWWEGATALDPPLLRQLFRERDRLLVIKGAEDSAFLATFSGEMLIHLVMLHVHLSPKPVAQIMLDHESTDDITYFRCLLGLALCGAIVIMPAPPKDATAARTSLVPRTNVVGGKPPLRPMGSRLRNADRADILTRLLNAVRSM